MDYVKKYINLTQVGYLSLVAGSVLLAQKLSKKVPLSESGYRGVVKKQVVAMVGLASGYALSKELQKHLGHSVDASSATKASAETKSDL